MSTLPHIFIIGDSISIGYGPYLKNMTEGRFEYDRKSGTEEALKNLDIPTGANGGDSERVAEYIQGMLRDANWKPDLVLMNCGLHDLKKTDTGHQVELDTYRANLETIVTAMHAAKIPMAWIRTTPVNETIHHARKPFDRMEADVDQYNAVADAVMNEHTVPMVDLFTMTQNLGVDESITNDGVHFSDEVKALQAAFLAGWLNAFFQ